MFPAVFPILSQDSDVSSLLGPTPLRVYRHGEAPQNVRAPYVTWFIVSGIPENELSDLPLVDAYSVQVDCWSNSDAEVELLAEAVRNAIEQHHHMTAIGPNGRDPTTMRFRIGMTFSFWTDRG